MGVAPDLEDPCHPIMHPTAAEPNPLVSAGLTGLNVPAALFDTFPAVNLTCVAGGTSSTVHVRGVFFELADDTGTVAIYAALHPLEDSSQSGWQAYLEETFADRELTFESHDGALLAFDMNHAHANVAMALVNSPHGSERLWRYAEPLTLSD